MKTNKTAPNAPLVAWIYLMRIYCLVTRCAEKELKSKGLTLPRFDVIAQLATMQGCCSQETLCDKLLVTKGNISVLIDRMAEEHLVSRCEDPQDRRCNRVALTAKGRKIFSQVIPEQQACLGRLFSRFPYREHIQLKDSLHKLLQCIKQEIGGENGS